MINNKQIDQVFATYISIHPSFTHIHTPQPPQLPAMHINIRSSACTRTCKYAFAHKHCTCIQVVHITSAKIYPYRRCALAPTQAYANVSAAIHADTHTHNKHTHTLSLSLSHTHTHTHTSRVIWVLTPVLKVPRGSLCLSC